VAIVVVLVVDYARSDREIRREREKMRERRIK